jgi:hypothetical protein
MSNRFERFHDSGNKAMYGHIEYGYSEGHRAEVCYTVRYLMREGHTKSKAVANTAFAFNVGKSSIYRWLSKELRA